MDWPSDSQIALRPYSLADVEAVWEAARESLAELTPWMPWAHSQYAIHETRAWIESQAAAFAKDIAYEFAIVSTGGRCLGGCGLNQIDRQNRRANLGYWVRTSATGRGIATAAVKLLRQWAFDRTDLLRLEVLVAAGNQRSLRVAERAGAQREGLLRKRLVVHGIVHDAVLFSLIRNGGSQTR